MEVNRVADHDRVRDDKTKIPDYIDGWPVNIAYTEVGNGPTPTLTYILANAEMVQITLWWIMIFTKTILEPWTNGLTDWNLCP